MSMLPALEPLEQRLTKEQECLYKHVMKCFGPQDRTYAATYDTKDAPVVISLSSDTLIAKLEQVYNDHKEALPQITAVSKADDIVTYPGLAHLMKLILGMWQTPTSLPRFRYMLVGDALDKASPFQQGLINEKTPRIDMTTTGAITALTTAAAGGPGIRFQANYPASFQTVPLGIRESAISTASPSGGIYLNRNVFTTPISHTQNVSAFTVITDIKFQGL